jgi:hypothetical protein
MVRLGRRATPVPLRRGGHASVRSPGQARGDAGQPTPGPQHVRGADPYPAASRKRSLSRRLRGVDQPGTRPLRITGIRSVQLLLHLHTDPADDGDDVAIPRDRCWDRNAGGQATFCRHALGLFGKWHSRNRVRNAPARTGIHYCAEDNQQPHPTNLMTRCAASRPAARSAIRTALGQRRPWRLSRERRQAPVHRHLCAPLQAAAAKEAGSATARPGGRHQARSAQHRGAEDRAHRCHCSASGQRNDDRKPAPTKPAIVAATSRKQLKLARASRHREDRPEDPEAGAAMRAWLERAKWGRGP